LLLPPNKSDITIGRRVDDVIGGIIADAETPDVLLRRVVLLPFDPIQPQRRGRGELCDFAASAQNNNDDKRKGKKITAAQDARRRRRRRGRFLSPHPVIFALLGEGSFDGMLCTVSNAAAATPVG